MGEAAAAEDVAGIVVEVEAKRVVKAAPKAAPKAEPEVLKRVNRAAVNHVLVRGRVYVNVLDVQKVAVTVVNVLAKLVKANLKANLNPNQDPNQDQEQIKN